MSPRCRASELGEIPGTLRCRCGTFSLTAFAEHLAGEPARDSYRGVYTIGADDVWLKSLERQDAPTPAPEETGERRVDADGSHWQHFENELRQRAWRCISGPRAGTVELDERLFNVSTAEVRPAKCVAEGADAGMFD